MQNLRLETSSLLFGTIAIILFLLPYFLYTKEFFGENGAIQKGDYMSAIGKIIAIHITIVFFALAFTSIMEITMSYRKEFAPSVALANFFHTNANWEHLISLMISNHATSSAAGGKMMSDTALARQVVTNYYGLAIAFFMLVIPIIVIAITLTVGMKKDDRGEQNISEKLFFTSIIYAFVTFLVWFHALLASAYVMVFTESHFSFFKVMSTLWNLLLVQGATR